MAKIIETVDSEEDLNEFFIKTTQSIIKSEIKKSLKGFTSNAAINLINQDVDENIELKDALFDYFKKNNFELAIENFRMLFTYEYIEEFIPKKESDKILELLEKWENKVKK